MAESILWTLQDEKITMVLLAELKDKKSSHNDMKENLCF